MLPRHQLTLPGFATVKRLRRDRKGTLELVEYDVLQWRAHEALLDTRANSLPPKPRSSATAEFEAWRAAAQEMLAQPLPPIKPVQVWKLGPFIGASVLPWLQGKSEALTPADVEALKEHLRQKEQIKTPSPLQGSR